MAKSKAENFSPERLSCERKNNDNIEENLENSEEYDSSDEEPESEDRVTDLSSHVHNSKDSNEGRGSFQLNPMQLQTLPSLSERVHMNDVPNENKDHDHSHFHDDQPHIHHPQYHQDEEGNIHLRHGDHVYTSYHHPIREQNDSESEPRMNNHQNSQSSIEDGSVSTSEQQHQIQRTMHENHTVNIADHLSDISDKNNECTVEETHINQLQQYSVSVSGGVLITIPHHRSSLIHQESHNQTRDDVADQQPSTEDSNDQQSHILQMNHTSSSVQEEERLTNQHIQNVPHHAIGGSGSDLHISHHQPIHTHSLSNCNDINMEHNMGQMHPSDSSAQDEEENDAQQHNNNASTITHLLQQRQLLQSHEGIHNNLQQVDHNRNDAQHNAEQQSSLLENKDITAHIIQHGTELNVPRLTLDLSHNSSYPHIRSPSREFMVDRLGYHVNTSIHSDFARTLSAINDPDSNVDNLPLRSMLAPTAMNYLTSNSSVMGQRDLGLDSGNLHAVSTPSITYHHLPEVVDSPVTPTSSPLYLPGVTSPSSSKMLGMNVYARNHEANNVGSLMWSQVTEDMAQKPSSLSLPSTALLTRTNAGHMSSYVSDMGTWSGYDNVPQQLSHAAGGKKISNFKNVVKPF